MFLFMTLLFMFLMVFILCRILCMIGAVMWSIFKDVLYTICSFLMVPIILALIFAGLCTYPLETKVVIVLLFALGLLSVNTKKQARARK